MYDYELETRIHNPLLIQILGCLLRLNDSMKVLRMSKQTLLGVEEANPGLAQNTGLSRVKMII